MPRISIDERHSEHIQTLPLLCQRLSQHLNHPTIPGAKTQGTYLICTQISNPPPPPLKLNYPMLHDRQIQLAVCGGQSIPHSTAHHFHNECYAKLYVLLYFVQNWIVQAEVAVEAGGAALGNTPIDRKSAWFPAPMCSLLTACLEERCRQYRHPGTEADSLALQAAASARPRCVPG